jgi:DNA polymerase sigma
VPVVKLLYVGGLDVDITFSKFTQHGSEAESEVPASHPSTTFVRCLLQRYVALLPLVLMLKQLLAQVRLFFSMHFVTEYFTII